MTKSNAGFRTRYILRGRTSVIPLYLVLSSWCWSHRIRSAINKFSARWGFSIHLGKRFLLISTAIFFSGLVHEFGHFLALRMLGVPSTIKFQDFCLLTIPSFHNPSQMHVYMQNLFWIGFSGGFAVFIIFLPFSLRYRYLLWIPFMHLFYAIFEPAYIMLRLVGYSANYELLLMLCSGVFSVFVTFPWVRTEQEQEMIK